MNNDRLLDQYIDEEYSDCKPCMTDEQRKSISETTGFALFCLRNAVDEFKSTVKSNFLRLFGDPK